ncbi:MAG: GNAT family N-acetyltransferase [Phyllobacterium sp.]|uniref:GNAT family N-acetyltransferase n=1 Tax=Phyllobacterium sp. TaxID=1871046 RepID=UPI0030F0F159
MDAEVRDNQEKHRFERQIHDGSWAAAYYRLEDGKLVFFHVEVPEFSSQGIGAALVQGVFDILRERGEKAVIKCSFMESFLQTHPEYQDVVDTAR